LGRDVIGRLVEDRNETGGAKQLRIRKKERRERETNVTSWCVSSGVIAVEAK
jgi:hypothetical protein